MRTMKGPALLISQLADEKPPFNSLPTMAKWAAGLCYKGLQLPSLDARFIDVPRCAESQTYADEIIGTMKDAGLEVTELASALEGQLVSVHPAYDRMVDAFAPASVQGNPAARQAWAVERMKLVAKASRRLGLKTAQCFTGSLAWPYVYPWPQRPSGLIEETFAEQARRWRPILDAFDEAGVDIAFELHPGQDVFDGETFEQFLAAVDNHPRCNINYDASHFIKQGLDYVEFIDFYHARIKAFHVKDAEFRPTGRQGFYSGYRPWLKRAARDRSLGDGQATSPRSSRSSPSTISRAGPCTNGRIVSSAPTTRRRKAPRSSPPISSASPTGRSTISRRPAPPSRSSMKFSGSGKASRVRPQRDALATQE